MTIQEIIRWINKTKDLDALDGLMAVLRRRQDQLREEVQVKVSDIAVKWMKSLPRGTKIRFKTSSLPDAEICKHARKRVTVLFDKPVTLNDGRSMDTMWHIAYANHAAQIQTVDPDLSLDVYKEGRAKVKAEQKSEVPVSAKMGQRKLMV